MTRNELLAEAHRQIAARRILDDLHPGQRRVCFAAKRAATNVLATFVALLSPRRWGKSVGVLRLAVATCLRKPRARVLYVSLLRTSAKEIAWPILQELCEHYGIKAKFDALRLTITFDNGSRIRLVGADHPQFARLLRGIENDLVIVDEAQDFLHVDLHYLVMEVLGPTLDDRRGRLFLCGTPGDEEAGYFWEVIVDRRHPQWACVQGEAGENPHNREQLEQREADLRREYPDLDEQPWFLRERRGRWVADNRRLLVPVGASNHVPNWKPAPGERYVLGVSWGFEGWSAYAWAAWNPQRDAEVVYLDGWRREGMTVADHVDTIATYRRRCGDHPLQVVVQAGQRTRDVCTELENVYRLPVEQAPRGAEEFTAGQVKGEAKEGRIKFANWTDPDRPQENGVAKLWSSLAERIDPRTKQRIAPNPPLHVAALVARRAMHPETYRPHVQVQESDSDRLRRTKEARLRRERNRRPGMKVAG